MQAWDQVTGGCPRDGYNGVRASHRNAWSLIDTVSQYRLAHLPGSATVPWHDPLGRFVTGHTDST